MGMKLISAPSEDPVTVAEARAQCRITETTEDALLAIYIKAATALCESKTGRKLVSQTWRQSLDEFPCGEIDLQAVPAQSIASLAYVDSSGVDRVLASDQYVLDSETYPGGWLLPADGTSWPDTDDVANAVSIDIVAGYGAAASVPQALKLWILATVATFYANRESVDFAGTSAELPARVIDGLLDEFKVY